MNVSLYKGLFVGITLNSLVFLYHISLLSPGVYPHISLFPLGSFPHISLLSPETFPPYIPAFPWGLPPIYLCFPLGSFSHVSLLSRGVFPPYIPAFPWGLLQRMPVHNTRWSLVKRRNISLKLFFRSIFAFQNNRKGYIKHKLNVIQGKRVQQKGKKKSKGKKAKRSTWSTDPVM